MCDIKVEERGENKQKQEEAREEGYLYLMLISDDGRVIFTTQEDFCNIIYHLWNAVWNCWSILWNMPHMFTHMRNWCIEYINSIYRFHLSWLNVADLIVHIISLMNHISIWETGYTNRSAGTLFKILSDLIARSTTLQLVWLCLKMNVLHTHTQTFSHTVHYINLQ